MTNLHIGDVPEFIKDPVALAFTTYVVGSVVGLPFSQTQLTKCNVALGKGEIRYRLYLSAREGYTFEFFIVMLADELGMMVYRTFKDGVLDEDSIGLTQYQHRAYDLNGVLNLVKALPMQPPVDYHICGCPTKH